MLSVIPGLFQSSMYTAVNNRSPTDLFKGLQILGLSIHYTELVTMLKAPRPSWPNATDARVLSSDHQGADRRVDGKRARRGKSTANVAKANGYRDASTQICQNRIMKESRGNSMG